MNKEIYEQKFYNPYIKTDMYKEVKGIVDKLYPDTIILKAKNPSRVRRHIVMYVINIIASKQGVIAISRSNTLITSLKSNWHTYRLAIIALDLMIGTELVDYQEGQNSMFFDKGFSSRIYANSKFNSYFGDIVVVQPEINEEDVMDIEVNKKDNALLVEMGQHYLEVADRKSKVLNTEYFGKMDLTHSSIEVPEFIHNVKLTRIYKDDGCGRFFQCFATSYQNVDKETRRGVLINGKKTAELDYSGMHINLLYNRVGKSSPYTDNYVPVIEELGVESSEELRDIVKHCIFVMINAKSYKSYVVSFNKKEVNRKKVAALKEAGLSLKKVYDTFCIKHEDITQFINSNASISLMLEESNIMQNVLMELMGLGINALPLHDSVVFEKGRDSEVIKVMEDEYFKYTGFKINVEYKNKGSKQ